MSVSDPYTLIPEVAMKCERIIINDRLDNIASTNTSIESTNVNSSGGRDDDGCCGVKRSELLNDMKVILLVIASKPDADAVRVLHVRMHQLHQTMGFMLIQHLQENSKDVLLELLYRAITCEYYYYITQSQDTASHNPPRTHGNTIPIGENVINCYQELLSSSDLSINMRLCASNTTAAATNEWLVDYMYTELILLQWILREDIGRGSVVSLWLVLNIRYSQLLLQLQLAFNTVIKTMNNIFLLYPPQPQSLPVNIHEEYN